MNPKDILMKAALFLFVVFILGIIGFQGWLVWLGICALLKYLGG
jgi:hypothetical protein